MNMKLTRQRLCLVVLSSAFGIAGLAQAGTVERNQAQAVAQPRVLDDAQMAQESAGATISYGALQSNRATGKESSQSANSYSRGCSTATRCRR